TPPSGARRGGRSSPQTPQVLAERGEPRRLRRGQRFLKIEHPRSHAPVVGELRALLRDAVPKRGERVLPRRETALRLVGRQQSGEPQREVRLAFEGGLRAEPFRNTPAEAITSR